MLGKRVMTDTSACSFKKAPSSDSHGERQCRTLPHLPKLPAVTMSTPSSGHIGVLERNDVVRFLLHNYVIGRSLLDNMTATEAALMCGSCDIKLSEAEENIYLNPLRDLERVQEMCSVIESMGGEIHYLASQMLRLTRRIEAAYSGEDVRKDDYNLQVPIAVRAPAAVAPDIYSYIEAKMGQLEDATKLVSCDGNTTVFVLDDGSKLGTRVTISVHSGSVIDFYFNVVESVSQTSLKVITPLVFISDREDDRSGDTMALPGNTANCLPHAPAGIHLTYRTSCGVIIHLEPDTIIDHCTESGLHNQAAPIICATEEEFRTSAELPVILTLAGTT